MFAVGASCQQFYRSLIYNGGPWGKCFLACRGIFPSNTMSGHWEELAARLIGGAESSSLNTSMGWMQHNAVPKQFYLYSVWLLLCVFLVYEQQSIVTVMVSHIILKHFISLFYFCVFQVYDTDSIYDLLFHTFHTVH